MKHKDFTLAQLVFPGTAACYQIPPFQRNYRWGDELLHRFVSDIYDVSTVGYSHWIGISLLGESEQHCELVQTQAGHKCYEILDGQQRLITLRIWLVALIDEFESIVGEAPKKFRRDDVTSISVHSLDADDWDKLRRATHLAAKSLPGSRSRILSAYWYFRYLLLRGSEILGSDDVVKLPEPLKDKTILDSWLATSPSRFSQEELVNLMESSVEKLMLSILSHEQKTDEPVEKVFQTLNGNRAQLEQYDLVRNFLMIESKFKAKQQRDFYSESLEKAERTIQDAQLDKRKSNLDEFLYDFLIAEGCHRFDEHLNRSDAERVFVKYWSQRDASSGADVKSFVEEKFTPAMRIWVAVAGGADDIQLADRRVSLPAGCGRIIRRIENFSRGPLTPLVLLVVEEWIRNGGDPSSPWLREQLSKIETRVVRQYLGAMPLSPLRAEVIRLCGMIRKDGDFGVLTKWVQESPSDERVIRVITQSCSLKSESGPVVDRTRDEWIHRQDLYERLGPRQLRSLFDGLTQALEGNEFTKELMPRPGERASKNEKISIEHLYPQDPSEWVEDINDWGTSRNSMDLRLHSLGNLSVLPLKKNQKMGKRRFHEKKRFFESEDIPNWKVTRLFMEAPQWSPVEIDERTQELAQSVIRVWPIPS